ncbi:FkbM family methyltransferase [Pedobacter deserti]|uniref:FkbM family methyltransferase n=1 Tax=Pedobacter deserti TaxID=2817382 RepID=UPI00210AD2D8|nr:FkbM family methyltransferase [Pedobacter sp. SYSU D00382]
MSKEIFKFYLQKLLGFRRYLFLFAWYAVKKALRGKYEPALNRFISMIPDRDIILDIGANIGITMVPLALAKPNARIMGFEPISENFETAKLILKHFRVQNSEIHNVALSDQRGSLTMVMPLKSGARQQGLSKVEQTPGKSEDGIRYTVESYTLDELIKPGQKISAIKIDVENYEYEVLKGGINMLKASLPIIYCELWDNEKRKKVFDLLDGIGYMIYVLDDDFLTPIAIDPNYKGASNNFIFSTFEE